MVMLVGPRANRNRGCEQDAGAAMITSSIVGAAGSSARQKPSPWCPQLGGRRLRGAAPARDAPAHEVGDPQQVVRQHRRAHEHLEPLAPLEQAAPHAPAAQQDRDAALDARAEALPLLERATLLVRGSLVGLAPAPLPATLPDHARGGRKTD